MEKYLCVCVCLSYAGDKSVAGLWGGEVQWQDIRSVTVEDLQQLSTLHIPQSTCAITAACKELENTHMYTNESFNWLLLIATVQGFGCMENWHNCN